MAQPLLAVDGRAGAAVAVAATVVMMPRKRSVGWVSRRYRPRVRVRTGEPGDAAFVLEMARFASTIEDRPLPPADDPELALCLPPAPDAGVLAVGPDDRPVGAAWWHLREPPLLVAPDGAPVPELVVAVLPPERGRGVGHRLLDALAARAAERGHAQLALNVHIRNPAVRLYSRAGFVVAGKGRGPLGVAMVRRTG